MWMRNQKILILLFSRGQSSAERYISYIAFRWPGGGDSLIKSEMILLGEALKSNGDYYHLISGFDLPLHDMDYIDDLNIKVKSSSISVNSVKQ